MKAAVVTPSICDFYFTPGRASALGALSLLNQLKKIGISGELYNMPLMNPRGKKIPIPKTFDYLKPYIIQGERGPISFFNSYKRFGPSPEESARIVLLGDPDIVFISLFAWAYADDAMLFTKELIRQQKRKITISIGGAGVAVFPEYFKKHSLFDYIITGDAEDVIPHFIHKIESAPSVSVPHLYGVEGSSSALSNKKPTPVASLHLDSRGKQWLSLILSRGCPLQCKFCSNHLTQGRVFRGTEIEEMMFLLKKMDISLDMPLHINLEDDNLLIRKGYFKDFLLNIKEIYPHATFSIENGLDYTYMTPDYIDFLIDMGFISFTLSIGSSDSKILEEEQRPANFEQFEEILRHLQKRNIPVKTFLICGLPGDHFGGILSSLLYLHKLPTDTGISMFYPVPGLPRFEDRALFGSKPSHLCCGSSAYPWADALTTSEMVTAFRLARFSNFIKGENTSMDEPLINRIIREKTLYTYQGKSRNIVPVPSLDNHLVKEFLTLM